MRIFGRALSQGTYSIESKGARTEYTVEKRKSGFKVTGKAQGRLGRIEVFRGRAPREFLLNNWQSWGPFQKMRPGERHPGIEEVMRTYSQYVFTPVPEVFTKGLVSDYFIAWPGHLMGFLSSRFAHPFFAIEGDELAGYLEYFDTLFDESIPLEPLIFLQNGSDDAGSGGPSLVTQESPVEGLLEEYADLAAAENSSRVPAQNPVGWSSWYQYFANLQWEDIEKNLRLAREVFPFAVFQVDDGFEKDIGDWLSAEDGFRPLPELARLICGQGFAAGIWTAPFSAAETSELFQKHPDWMVQEDGAPKECYRNWGKKIYVLAAGTLDNMIFESDDFALVDDRGRGLLRKAVALQGGRVRARGLLGPDIYLIRSQGGRAGEVRLIANLSERSNKYEAIEVPPRSARLLRGPA